MITAAPHLAEEAVGQLATSVLLLNEGQVDRALTVARRVARRSSALERRAYGTRVRRLKERRPDLDAIDQLTDVLAPSMPDLADG